MASFPRRHCEMCKHALAPQVEGYSLRHAGRGALVFWLCPACFEQLHKAVKAMAWA